MTHTPTHRTTTNPALGRRYRITCSCGNESPWLPDKEAATTWHETHKERIEVIAYRAERQAAAAPAIVPTVQPCGTEAAYKRHQYRKETPCQTCRKAHADYNAEYRRRKREAA